MMQAVKKEKKDGLKFGLFVVPFQPHCILEGNIVLFNLYHSFDNFSDLKFCRLRFEKLTMIILNIMCSVN